MNLVLSGVESIALTLQKGSPTADIVCLGTTRTLISLAAERPVGCYCCWRRIRLRNAEAYAADAIASLQPAYDTADLPAAKRLLDEVGDAGPGETDRNSASKRFSSFRPF